MAIQSFAQQKPVVVPNPGLPFASSNGNLTGTGRLSLQGLRNFVVNMSRSMPCDATGTNVITLTLLEVQPQVDQYASYDSYQFVALNSSSGLVTAKVVTEKGTLATLKVFKNGGTQANTGDIVAATFYTFTYDDSLDGGAGGFVITNSTTKTIASLTDSTGGVVAATLVAITGTGADTDINANIASLNAKLDAVLAALKVP